MTLCQSDPLLDLVRETFDANPLKVPDERIVPLSVLIATKKSARYLGTLDSLVRLVHPLPSPVESEIRSLRGVRSTAVERSLGLRIFSNLMRGFSTERATLGAASGADDQETVSFFFPEPRRVFVDPLQLGAALDSAIFHRNPATRALLTNEHKILIVDSVLVAKQIGVQISRRRARHASGMISPLTASGSATSASSDTLIFEGERELSFAFSAVQLQKDEDGGNLSFVYDRDLRTVGVAPHAPIVPADPVHVHVGDGSDLVEIEE